MPSSTANERAIAAAVAAGVPRDEAERIVAELAGASTSSSNGHHPDHDDDDDAGADAAWIVVPRFHEHTHPDATRTGNIPWIKTHTRLLSDDAYLSLTGHERAVLHGLWLEYARSRAGLRVDTISLSRRLSLKVTKRVLERLNHAGFLHFSASRPASSVQANLQALKRREENPPTPHGDTSKTTKRHRTTNTTNPSNNTSRVDPSKLCPDCQQPLGHGHLETCPRMPHTA